MRKQDRKSNQRISGSTRSVLGRLCRLEHLEVNLAILRQERLIKRSGRDNTLSAFFNASLYHHKMHFGGPDGELGASMRYLNQRFSMPDRRVAGMLTDIGTEELAHLEIVGAILYQLTRNLTEEQIKASGFDTYFVDHTAGVYTQAASGFPFSAATFQVKGDPITDLHEDLAADATTAKEQPTFTRARKPLI